MFEQQLVEGLDLIAAPRLLRGHATLRAPQLPRLVLISSTITRAKPTASRIRIILFIVLIVRAVESLDQIASACMEYQNVPISIPRTNVKININFVRQDKTKRRRKIAAKRLGETGKD